MTDRGQQKRVVIVGGGFGGAYTAMHLESAVADGLVDVTLINPENYFLFTPMLAEIVSSQIDTSHAINPLRRLLPRTRFIEGRMIGLDPAARLVRVLYPTGEEDNYPYDHLVLAVGARTGFFGLGEVARHAYTAKTLGDAIVLRNRVIALLEMAAVEQDPSRRAAMLTIVVAGAGFTGVEIAGEVNDLLRRAAVYYPSLPKDALRVLLVEGQSRILPEFDPGLAAFAASRLQAAGVEVRTETFVSGATAAEVMIRGGNSIASRTLIWTTGVAPRPTIEESDVPKVGRGWIKVDATLRVEGPENVWALGDCAQIPDLEHPGHFQPALAQHAMREAATLAHNIVASIRGEPVAPFRYRTLGQLATLGHYNGVGTIGPLRLSGFVAWFAWRTYYLWRLPRWEKRLRVATDWFVDLIFGRDISQIQIDTAHVPEEDLDSH